MFYAVLVKKVVNVQPEVAAGADCMAAPRLWPRRALNVPIFRQTENRTTILYVQIHND